MIFRLTSGLKITFIFLSFAHLSFISNGQGNRPLISINYATHTQQAYNTNEKKMYMGRYSAARNQYISDLKKFIQTDNVIDASDIAGLKDNRPRYIKLLEKVEIGKFKEDQFLPFTQNLNSMGIYYHSQGQYTLADFLFTKCLKIQGDKFGKTNEIYVSTLQNLGNLRKDQGRFDASEDILKYVLRYYQNVLGEESQHYIIALNNKAMLDANLGRTEEAIQEIDRAILLYNKLEIGNESIDGERIQINRALIALEEKDYTTAKSLLLNAKESLETKSFEKHPDYNDLIIFLGSIYLHEGSATHFTPLLEKSIQNIESTYGNSHPYYANVLELQSEYHLLEGDFSKAKPMLQSIVTIRLDKLGDRHPKYLDALNKLAIAESYTGDPKLALTYFTKSIETYLHLTSLFFGNMSEVEQAKFWKTFESNIQLFYEFAISHPDLPGVTDAVLNLQLNTKGILLNNNIRVREKILSSNDPNIKNKFLRWQVAKDELAGYFALSPEDLNYEGIDLNLKEKEINDLEKELIRESNYFSQSLSFNTVKWQDIQKELSESEAALQILKVSTKYGLIKDNNFYIAIILKNNGSPIMIKLKNGDELEDESYKYYQNAIKYKIEDNSSYQKYWGPIESYMVSSSRIYVSPDGIYNSVSLQTLKGGTGYLLDNSEVVIVSSLKSLTGNKQNNEVSKNLTSVLVGNPSFGNPSTIVQLPGAEIEVEKIDTLMRANNVQTELYIGEKATETVIKECNNPAVLHIATHGYFLADVSFSSLNTLTGIQVSNSKKNPLLRSGLLLTGAASGLSQEMTFDKKDNGVLTAFEAMNLNLEKTRLVVLSACETGLGEVVNGEGVYGLSRALKIAGSNAVIISLWKVDDQSTLLLMTTFYQLWMETNEIESSFIAAQKLVRQSYPEPFYWGAFILMRG